MKNAILIIMLLLTISQASTQLLKTVKPTGGDYTALSTAISSNAKNLVTADQYLVVKIDGTWSSNDAIASTINITSTAGFVTDATHYIYIHTTTAAQSSYHLVANDCDAFLVKGVNNVQIEGLNITISSPTAARNGIYFNDAVDANFIFTLDKNVINVVNPLTYACYAINFYFAGTSYNGSLRVYDNIVYGFDGTSCYGYYQHDIVTASLYNNTFYNDFTGVVVSAGTITAKNNLFCSNSVAASGTFLAGTDYNGCSNASMNYTVTGAGNTHDRINQAFTFVDSAARNFHLAATDTGATGRGVTDPGAGLFSTDIDSQTFAVPLPMGADQYQSTGPTQFTLTTASSYDTLTPAAGGHTVDSGVTTVISFKPIPGRIFCRWHRSNASGIIADSMAASTTIALSAKDTVTAIDSAVLCLDSIRVVRGGTVGKDSASWGDTARCFGNLSGVASITFAMGDTTVTTWGLNSTHFDFRIPHIALGWDTVTISNIYKTVTANNVFKVVVSPVYVTITSSAGTGGTVAPLGAIVVQALADTSITATAAMGYRFALWTGSANVSIATPTTATTTFHSLDSSNGTITANFSRMWYASSPQTCYTHTSYNFPITAQNETIDSFKTSANPTLVCGLTLNHLTGTISGKPRAGTWYKWGYKIYGYHNGAIIDSCYDSMTISDVAPIDYQGMGHSIMQGAPYCTSQGSDSFEMQPMYWVSYYSGDTGTFHNWGLGGNSTFNTWYNLINYASGLQRKCTWILQGVKDYMWSSLSDTDANLIKRDTLIWYFDSMAKFLNNQHWKGVFCGMTPVVQPYIPSPGLPTFNDAFQRRHQLQKDQAYRHGLYFSDLWDSTIDLATGNLKTAYSYDGLHLTREGTKAIARAMVACYPPYIGKTYKTQCTIVYPDSAMPGGPDTTAWLFTVDLSRLPHAIIDSARIDGYDITVSGPFGELPKDLVFFNKIARTGVLHFRGYKNVKTYTVKSGSGAEYNSPYIYIDNKILQCYHLNDRSAVLSQGVFLDAASNVDGSVVTGITHGIVGPWGDTVSKFIFPPSPGYTYGKFIRSSEFSRRSKFSVSFALKQNTYSDAEIFTIYKASDAYKYLNCEIIGDSLQLQIADSIDNGLRNWTIKIPYTTAIADTGHWHHYLICLNNGIATAFLDGSKRVTTYNPLAVWNQTPSYDGGYDMWIGLNPLGGRGLNGGLSELRFLNTSFTDSEAVSYQKMEMLSTGMNVPTSSGGGFRRGGFGFGFFNWVQRAFR